MRVFWAFIMGLTLLTAAMWIVPTSASSPDAVAINDGGATNGSASQRPLRSRTSSSSDAGSDRASQGGSSDDAADVASAASEEGDASGEDDDVVPLDPEAEALLDDLMDDYDDRRADDSADAGNGTSARADGAVGGGEGASDAANGTTAGDQNESGDRFVVNGSGTPDDPYEITWDLLVSAAETYSPRMGMTDMPERIERLDGAHVRITGYLAFPLPGQMNDEVLVMLNEWDGCCLGVPPSPYDAIEVRLSKSVQSQRGQHLVSYGTVEGKLEVDPYVVEDWLLGLYLMDGANIEIDM